MWKRFKHLDNTFITWLLRSRFHSALSRFVLLLTVTGRKSGQQYTFPVEYGRNGSTVLIVSQPSRTWWRNIQGRTPVTMLIQGKQYVGTAAILTDDSVIAHAIRSVYPAKSLEQAAQFSQERVVIRIELEQSE